LLWNANVDGVTEGYRVYVRQEPGPYDDGVDVGDDTEFPVNLVPGTTYRFIVRAYNADLVLGPPSTELVFPVPNTPPVMTNPGPQNNAPGNVIALTLTATDSDGDGVTFPSVTGLPPGLTAPLNGQITGTLGAGSPGTYNVSATASDGNLQDVENFTWRVISFTAPSSVNSGAQVSTNIAHAPGNAGDWVGLYRVGATMSQYCDWNYLNGMKSQPASGSHTAALSFTSDCPGSGDLELRFFVNNTATVLATAGPIAVASATTAVIAVNGVTPPDGLTAAGGAMLSTRVTISGPVYAGDWVGLYPVGGSVGQYVDWKYLNGTQSPPASGTADATVSFTMPAVPGNYDTRLFTNYTATVVGTSSTISLAQAATIAVN
jgi:hypothetical protein